MGLKTKPLSVFENSILDKIKKDQQLKVRIQDSNLLPATWIVSSGLKMVHEGYAENMTFEYVRKSKESVDLAFVIDIGRTALELYGAAEVSKSIWDKIPELQHRIEKWKSNRHQKKLRAWINDIEITKRKD